MATNKLCLLLVFLAVCTQNSTGFDYLLAMQWQPSLCNVGINCVQPIQQAFTIHGLWPIGMSNCAGSAFDPNKLGKNLRRRLTNGWPDVYKRRHARFWRREWNKHGTCAETTTFTQVDYFRLALNLQNQLNIGQILANANIVPGNPGTYALSFIENRIRNAIGGFDVQIICNGPPQQPMMQLQEIRVCYDQTGSNLVNCPPLVFPRCLSFVTFPN